MHVHVHIIPRFAGDMADPRGGVRGVIPSKQKYALPSTSPAFFDLPGFVSGEEHHFLQALRRALELADSADLLSAFIQHGRVPFRVEFEMAAASG